MTSQPLRIVFAGTPEFAVPTLSTLLEAEQRVCTVYTQPDRPAGRGRQLRPSPVKSRALEAGLPVRQPPTLRDPAAQDELAALHPDLMVVIAYGLILPKAVLEIPRLGCVNVHASLLPRWRGAAPIQRAILAGDAQTGITLMQMDEGLDTGPILGQTTCPIPPGTTAGELHDRLAELGAQTLMRHLPALAQGRITPRSQDERLATYAAKLDKAEAELRWNRPATELERQVLAFNPWPVAHTRTGDRILRIWRAKVPGSETAAPPGKVLDEGPEGIDVATACGILRLTEVQFPGKRPLAAADFVNAYRLKGVTLGAS